MKFNRIKLFKQHTRTYHSLITAQLCQGRHMSIAQLEDRLNVNKIEIASEQVNYFVHIFIPNEMKPDRLKAIERMGRPKNKKDLQAFIDVKINYDHLYRIYQYSTIEWIVDEKYYFSMDTIETWQTDIIHIS